MKVVVVSPRTSTNKSHVLVQFVRMIVLQLAKEGVVVVTSACTLETKMIDVASRINVRVGLLLRARKCLLHASVTCALLRRSQPGCYVDVADMEMHADERRSRSPRSRADAWNNHVSAMF